MSRRLTLRPLRPLRLAVLTGVVAGALLVPASAAFATDPTPTPGATDLTPEGKEALEKKAEDARTAKEAEARKAEAAKAGSAQDYPRGGVAAGEAPAGDNTGTLIGSATGALLLAGAGTYVLRRRTTARREG